MYTLNRYLKEALDHGTLDFMGLTFATDYAEPGYTAGEKGVAFGNWNDRTRWNPETQRSEPVNGKLGPKGSTVPSRLGKVLEAAGYEIEWSDEWTTCEDCNRAIRTSADSYGWRASYVMIDDCAIVCEDCAVKDPDTLLEQYVNDPHRAMTFDFDFEGNGWKKWNSERFENGFHPGQTDDPRTIAKEVEADGYPEWVFHIPAVGQFDIHFNVYVKVRPALEVLDRAIDRFDHTGEDLNLDLYGAREILAACRDHLAGCDYVKTDRQLRAVISDLLLDLEAGRR
jgi:hypothetical protein